MEEDIDTEVAECIIVDVEISATEHIEELVPTWNTDWIEDMLNE